MMNVYDTSKSHELLMATGATLKRVFTSVEVISRTDGTISCSPLRERNRWHKSESAWNIWLVTNRCENLPAKPQPQ